MSAWERGSDGGMVRWKGTTALALKAQLDAGTGISKDELNWLYETTGRTKYLSSAERLCQQLIDDLTLQQVTEQLLR